MRKQIVIIGNFGGDQQLCDGQTIKTNILFDELKKCTDWDIQTVDTYWRVKKPIRLVLKVFGAIMGRRDIVVLLSINGMRVLFPLLYLSTNIRNKRIYHDVIGGCLDKYVIKYPRFKKYLNSFDVNWVETETQKTALNEYGIGNCQVIPNFKRISIVSENELSSTFQTPFRFCTFSRVIREKGIEDAIYSIEEINAQKGSVICTLDIFGAIDKSYESRFKTIMGKTSPSIRYCGLVPYNDSVNVIKKYYALLFPTFWESEGMPGTIIDAFSAGLPVIASDWNSNKEIIQDMYNGIIYPRESIKNLKEAILFSMNNSHIIGAMKRTCIKSAEKYRPDSYVKMIVEEIEKH